MAEKSSERLENGKRADGRELWDLSRGLCEIQVIGSGIWKWIL